MISREQRSMFLEAITAYARWCWTHQQPYRHPDNRRSAVGYRYVTLRNQSETLGRYDRATGRILFTFR